ncbi:MAG: hypothetical protein ABEJ70_09195 [Halobacteriaceae archaeon]
MTGPRAVAVNVGANTNAPGFRAPVRPDGSFTFLPIPESAPTREPPPTYGDLAAALPVEVPEEVRGDPVHLDPEFAGYPHGERYTYGDPWGVKARPLLDLEAGEYLLFYATLSPTGEGHPPWVPPEWGAFLVGGFRLARDPASSEAYAALPPSERRAFATNAHVRREAFDAAVLCLGDDSSTLFDRAVPLSADRGATPNALVTEHSADSGRGPWWRRPLRFDDSGTRAVLATLRGDGAHPGAGASIEW